MKTIRTILHPTDFSSASHFAMELACMLAREQRARLLLLHVVPRLQAKEGVPPLADEYQFELQRYQEDMKDKLRSLSMADSTVQIEYLQKEGEVADVIVRVADETASDLIVLGSHGRTGQHRLLMGATSEMVLRDATCPVLLVKMAGEKSS
jgi:nucleotide-binding universal stress UspA family protein